ncbi:YesL family protein [Gracilibacillus sp. S3-1-1]|uniref:YesL family protein n=1 Tax=Gracilibacillus pellucidus TaxID=3095368 RepID=A0ACC6M351_9BACI|nr:YesL family protein [Gracilibacillus sp. S3-1-1]MDX8045308.1 YesL family protein [Gracilibacillus sp. S3-1-1]
MKTPSFVNGLYRFCVWIMKLAYLNILWLFFTLIGLVVLGLGPATIAMFSVTRKWVQGEDDISVSSVFWENYKNNFWKSNMLFYIYFLIIYLLSVYYLLVRELDGIVGSLFIALVLIVTGLILFTILVSLPLFSHAKLSVYRYVKYSAMIVISNPFHMLALALAIFLIGVVFLLLPGLVPFFFGSVLSLMTMYIVSKILQKIEEIQLGTSF